MAELSRLRTGQRGDTRGSGLGSSRGMLSTARRSEHDTARQGTSGASLPSSRRGTGGSTCGAGAVSSAKQSSPQFIKASSHPEAGPSTRSQLQKVKQMRTGFVLGNDDPVACDVWTSAAHRQARLAGTSTYQVCSAHTV